MNSTSSSSTPLLLGGNQTFQHVQKSSNGKDYGAFCGPHYDDQSHLSTCVTGHLPALCCGSVVLRDPRPILFALGWGISWVPPLQVRSLSNVMKPHNFRSFLVAICVCFLVLMPRLKKMSSGLGSESCLSPTLAMCPVSFLIGTAGQEARTPSRSVVRQMS